jgi:predicted aspartyl protease
MKVLKGKQQMGRTVVKIIVANNGDVLDAEKGSLAQDQVRRVELQGVVDTGATRLVLPKSVVEQLGLVASRQIGVRYADQRRAKRPLVQNVWLEMQGRDGVFSAVVEPLRKDALIGAIVMEELDFVVDCISQKVRPRDPRGLFAEIE